MLANMVRAPRRVERASLASLLLLACFTTTLLINTTPCVAEDVSWASAVDGLFGDGVKGQTLWGKAKWITSK